MTLEVRVYWGVSRQLNIEEGFDANNHPTFMV